MEKRVDTLRTVKAFWMTKGGLRQYLNVSITEFGMSMIGLRIELPGHFEHFYRLSSVDGFNFFSNTDSTEAEYEMNFRCFLRGSKILLYGNWKAGDSEGEICIHAVLQKLIIKTDMRRYRNDLPPAA